jgi:Na+-exporting ATPase
MVVGMAVMRNANVVVRDLSALEALGGVTNIRSDKTGTLTQGAMIVKKVWLPKIGIYTVNNSTDPSDPTQGDITLGPESTKTPVQNGRIDYDGHRSAAALKFDVPLEKVTKDQLKEKHTAEELAGITPELEDFLRPTALCNLATVKQETVDEKSRWQTTGEPTEIALQVFANRFDYGKRRLKSEGWNQIAEFPFDSTIKRMSVVYKSPRTRESFVFTKGAVERVLDLCSTIGTNSIYEPITEDLKEQVLNQMDEFANQGQRVLAIASKKWSGDFPEQHGSNVDDMRAKVESGLMLLGLVGIYDPPRDETKEAIRECEEAGIKVHMLTVSQHSTDVGLELT